MISAGKLGTAGGQVLKAHSLPCWSFARDKAAWTNGKHSSMGTLRVHIDKYCVLSGSGLGSACLSEMSVLMD